MTRDLEKIRDEIVDEAHDVLDAVYARDVVQCMAAIDRLMELVKEALGPDVERLSRRLNSLKNEDGFWEWYAVALTQWIEARAATRKAMDDARKD